MNTYLRGAFVCAPSLMPSLAHAQAADDRGFQAGDKQIFIEPEARIDSGLIVAKTHLDPTVVGAGIGLRF